ncbi:hypothetical protein [Streptomyces sp. NPDC017941]|uniref:hypothetical protein n=1 Tax=Streptomyces sp. NPDC017941 TaxID=3365018 RepID=UPI00379B2ED1
MAGVLFGSLYGSEFGGEFGFPGESARVDLSVQITLGFVVAAKVTFVFATVLTSWPHFLVARTYLTVRRQVPRNLMAFLQDAHEHRGILRQVGPVYQFSTSTCNATSLNNTDRHHVYSTLQPTVSTVRRLSCPSGN